MENSLPVFSTATETISDLSNQRIINSLHSLCPHHLDEEVVNMPLPPVDAPSNSLPTSYDTLATPPGRDPSLPLNPMQGYIDIFVGDFSGLVKGNEPNRHVQLILLHAINQLFCPLDITDNKFCQEPVSVF